MSPKWKVNRDHNDYSVVAGNARVAGYIVRRETAQLIAAAPELLEALQALRDNVEKEMSGYWAESTANLMQQAEKAIARARRRTKT